MGMEGVRLLMAYEEVFDIKITDLEAEQLHTPADVITLVLSKLGEITESACHEQQGFHRIRAAILEMTLSERRLIRPTTPLAELFRFVPPDEVRRRLSRGRLSQTWMPIEEGTTVGDLARWLGTDGFLTLKRGSPWTRQEVATLVKKITLKELPGVEYGENRRFVEDLGIG